MFGRRRHERHDEIVAAKGEVATAFREMDGMQRQVIDRVLLAAQVDRGARGQALLDRVRGASAEADAAACEWLRLGGETDEPSEQPATDADQQLLGEYLAVRNQLVLAHEALSALLVEVGPELGAIEQSLAEIPRRVQEAQQAMRDAETAVEALRLDGLAPEEAEQALIRMHQRAVVLAEGPAVHGIAEILEAVQEAIAVAGEARRRAELFPGQRDDISRQLVAARSRLQIVEEKGTRLDGGLAALRHGYHDNSWRDLREAPSRFQAALEESEDALEQAESSARRLAYPQALRLLDNARTAFVRAEQQARLVTDRLASLDIVRADPRAPLAPVQFALDDARLLCKSGGVSDGVKACVARLSELAARLKAVPELVGGEQPDFYGYLVEIDAIQSEIESVVTDLRRG